MGDFPMKIVIEEPAGIERRNWPAARGVQFAQGLLRDANCVLLRNPEGAPLPLQAKVLSIWPDGSIQWLLLAFQVNLPAQQSLALTVEIVDQPVSPSLPHSLSVTQSGERYVFNTGPLEVEIDLGRGFTLFDRLVFEGRELLAGEGLQGFAVTTGDGTSGTALPGTVKHAVLEERGPLRAVLHVCGDHCDRSGKRLLSYEARLVFHAGLPWFELEYTFIQDSAEAQLDLQQISCAFSPGLAAARKGLVGAYKLLYESGEPFSIYQDAPCRYSFFSGTRIYDAQGNHVEYEHAGEMLQRAAHGWMDISDGERGLMVCVKNLAVMAPKAMAFDGDSLEVQFWPARAGALRLRQGMARTHRMMLYCHRDSGEAAQVNQAATAYDLDLAPWVQAEDGEQGLFGPLFAYRPRQHPAINIRLRDQFNSFYLGNMGLGFLDFGDSIQQETGPRAHYTANNEYDLPLALALQFLRTGEREVYDALEASTWHMMDVDFVHHSTRNPLEVGGVRIHGVDHVQYNCEGMPNFSIATSHMWTEGLLAYYLLSGHPAALARARSIGECLLRLIAEGWALPPYKVEWHSVRDSAWPIIALAALYEVTQETRWLQGVEKLADAVVDLQNPDGSWDLTIGWYNGTRVPLQLGIGINGLGRAHQLTGKERYKAAMLRAAQKLEESVFPEGNFMYIDAPGYRWNYTTPVVLEGLGYLWEITGDLHYLNFAKRYAQDCLEVRQMTGTSLAYTWRYLLRFLSWADQSGMLDNLVF